MSKFTTFGAFLDGRLAGTRTTKTMLYTHAVVTLSDKNGKLPQPVVSSYSQSERGAVKQADDKRRWGYGCVIVPVFAIDKKTGAPLDANIAPARSDPGSNDAACVHSFVCSGSAYGGDDDSYHGEGRSYCEYCGADGDA